MVEKSQKNATKIPAAAKVHAADGRRLNAFTALPSSLATILAPRRLPAVKASVGNGDDFVQIFTSNGFRALTNADYLASIDALRPDIAIPLADMHYAAAARVPHAKGLARMCERTEDWMAQLHARLGRHRLNRAATGTAVFAPTLPAPYPMQWAYLERLADDLRGAVDGLAVYDVDLLSDLAAAYPSLRDLPRLSLDAPADPHAVLRQVDLGVDLFLLPFVNTASDAGIALTFTFPPPEPESSPVLLSSSPPPAGPTTSPAPDGLGLLPLGIDLAAPGHATSLGPLAPGCACHACAAHHRAYLHHLLDAREMLAWVLLQVHNHHVAARFLAAARAALAAGTFGAARRRFHAAYEPDLPPGCGARPRARGYHFKSEGGDAPRNRVTWQAPPPPEERGRAGAEAGAEAGLGSGSGRSTVGGEEGAAGVMEERLASGTTESPVPPGEDVGADELVRGGMGEVVTKGDEER